MPKRRLIAATFAVALVGSLSATTLTGCTSYDPQQFVSQANGIAERVVALIEESYPKLKNKPSLEDCKKLEEKDFIEAFRKKHGADPSSKDIGNGADAIAANAEKRVLQWVNDQKNAFNKALQGIQRPNGVANQMFSLAACGELVGSSGDKPDSQGYFKGPKVKLAGKDAICNDGTGANIPKVLFKFTWDVEDKQADVTIVLSIR
jgi:hypothetical protein